MKIFAGTKQNKFEFESYFKDEQIVIKTAEGDIPFEIVSLGDGRYSLIKEYKSYFVRLIKSDGKYHVHVLGDHFILDVEDERSRKLKELVKSAESGPKEQEIKAPIPGLVVSVNVKVGDEVKQSDTLLVLEAMKMENVIKADCDCTVREIYVNEKDTVQQNQVLVKLVTGE